jgi:hypothetical protein
MQESSSPVGADVAVTPPAPPAPVRSARRIEWVLLLAATVAAAALFSYRGSYGRGTELDIPITLVTSDREDLGCAFDATVGDYRCEVKSDGTAWPSPPERKHRLAPYYSEDRRLFLLPGLFEQPALAERYRHEDPTGRARSSLRRFSARCKLRLVKKVEGFKVRWLHNDSWHDSGPAWVAEVAGCTVEDK